MRTESEHIPRNGQQADRETERLAAVLGPTIMAVTASEAMNYHIWDTQFPAVTYLNGLFLFVAGVSILQKAHRWTRRWPSLVTIFGLVGHPGRARPNVRTQGPAAGRERGDVRVPDRRLHGRMLPDI
jgi:hypothetical protein